MIDMLVSGCWYCCRSYQSGQFSNTSTNIYILGFSLVPNHRMLIYSISIGPLQQVPSQLWRRFLKTCMFTIDSTSALFDLDCWPLSLLWVKSFKPSDEGLTRIGSRLREVSEGGYLSRSEMEVSVHSPPSSAIRSYTNIPLGPSASCGSESKLVLQHLTRVTGKFGGAMWCVHHPTHKMIVEQVLYFHKKLLWRNS